MNCSLIRQASIADAPRVAPLFDRYRQFYDQPSDLQLAEAFLRDRLTAGDSVILLAEDDGLVVGFTQLYPTFSSVRARRGLILNDLFVEQRARGTGVARRLIHAAEDFAKANGVDRLSLSTGVENRTAQKLYRSVGWVLDERFLTFTRALED